MKISFISTLLFSGLLFSFVQAQSQQSANNSSRYLSHLNIHDVYDWEEDDFEINLSKEDSLEAAVILLDRKYYEFRTHRSDHSLKGYKTVHRKILLNTEEGLQELNRVYIPVTENSSIINFKGKSINPHGNVTYIDQSMLKDISNVEEYGSFKIFAMEGVQVGSIIEFTYTIPVPIRYSIKEFAQGKYPVKLFEFMIKGTRDVGFDVFSNNGLSSSEYFKEKNFNLHFISQSDISAVKEERYSAFNASRMSLDASMNEVYADMYKDWQYIRKTYSRYVEDLGKRSSKNLDIFIKGYTNYQYQNKYQQLVTLEHIIKKEITFINNPNPDLSDVRFILKDKNANKLGFVKLFSAILEKLNFKFEILSTTSRYQGKFDKNKPSLSYTNDFLFYLPEIDAYLSPLNFSYRVGMAPYYLANNNSLNLSKNDDHGFHMIKINSMEENNVNASYTINFDKNIENPILFKKNEWYGHRGSQYRYSYYTTPLDKKEEFIEKISLSGSEGIDQISSQVFNHEYDFQYAQKTPFILESELDISGIIENVGKDYIFIIGEIIGSQTDLYQEIERTLPVVLQYPIQYNHTIDFRIPEGYSVEGLEDLVHNEKIVDDKGDILGEYNAQYVIISDTVQISINEYYKVTDFSIEQYNSFRNVINSASEFNKLSILFIKED